MLVAAQITFSLLNLCAFICRKEQPSFLSYRTFFPLFIFNDCTDGTKGVPLFFLQSNRADLFHANEKLAVGLRAQLRHLSATKANYCSMQSIGFFSFSFFYVLI